jgi:hypothetical protein
VSKDEVGAFFARYRDAFDLLDGDAVADLWQVPGGIAHTVEGRAQLTWWPDDEPMRSNHRALCDAYRTAGYARAEFEIEHSVPLGPDHAFARVRWTLHRADGSVLQRFGTGYQLVRADDGPRVLLCTAYEEDLKEMTRHAAE